MALLVCAASALLRGTRKKSDVSARNCVQARRTSALFPIAIADSLTFES
jgi:hypothetical protein